MGMGSGGGWEMCTFAIWKYGSSDRMGGKVCFCGRSDRIVAGRGVGVLGLCSGILICGLFISCSEPFGWGRTQG